MGALPTTAGIGGSATGLPSANETVISTLTLDLPVAPLDSGHYEGWAIFDSEKVSTGKFSADADLTFVVDRDLLMDVYDAYQEDN